MREGLMAFDGQRLAVTAMVERFGCRARFSDVFEETLLLRNVRTIDGVLLADHLWLFMGARFGAVDPQPGDVLCFTARVRPYVKHKLVSRRNGRLQRIRHTLDYGLNYPTRVSKLAMAQEVQA